MKSKLKMTRPSEALLPAGFLAAALLSRDGDFALTLFGCLVLTRLLSLATAPATRLAYAEQPSMRRAGGTVSCALLVQPVGFALALALCAALFGGDIARWALLCGAGAFMNIEHVFYEYLFAAGERRSAWLCRGITAMLTAAGLMMASPVWCLALAALAAGVAAVVGVGIGGGLRGRVNALPLRYAPLELTRAAVYPATAWAAARLLPGLVRAPAVIVGWMVCALCRAPFRRRGRETRAMNRALLCLLAAAALAAAVLLLPAELPEAVRQGIVSVVAMAVAGGACGFALYGGVD